MWEYLVHYYHYLGLPKLVGEYLRYLAFIDGQVVVCLGWASVAFKVKDRDRFIGWDDLTRRKHLYLIANNTLFLILPWIRIKHLASKLLSLNLVRLSKCSGCGKAQSFWIEPGVADNFEKIAYGRIVGYRYH